ncbi:TRAP-type mannitol/chloroaromatic compound transport system permease small subunit [Azospirillum fermentarium]|uniref:TRAP transporter small permease subunit n=1 Tax=Azospirillum fermentarium TaxID=1233114 RepID=UPI00222719DC|nr:TRAP transporter small permease subunit [Azospirillum fermentarium]MCW2247060.1 TRAP-type mannitol/chloroaromatic compound transport system permease small subunit [Azospirillum fermentarium]
MNILLRLSRVIDAINNGVGHLTYWLVLVAVIISSGNATVRYVFNTSSNAWLELQWYLFSAIFLLCAGYTFLKNEHIRIDVVVGRFSKRVHAWIDVFGILFFLFPMAVLILVLSWPMVVSSYTIHEMSNNAGGLLRWPVKLLVPVGFALLVLQGVSELIKRIAFLLGLTDEPGEKMHGHS